MAERSPSPPLRTINEYTGDLLDVKPPAYIVHQTNCVTNYSKGLAYSIALKQGHRNDVYARREKHPVHPSYAKSMSTPGTIDVIHGNLNVVNLMGQVAQGAPNKYIERAACVYNGLHYPDDAVVRERYFRKGLDALVEFLASDKCQRDKHGNAIVVFPRNIGSGLAGGTWTKYRAMILDFANQVDDNTDVRIVARSPH